jgi:signal peptidase I
MASEQMIGAEAKAASLTREVIETAKTMGAALLLMLVLRVVVFQPYTIPTSSMEPGLVTGDYIVVSKWPYGWSRASFPFNPPLPGGRIGGKAPKRGDVIVFRLPRDPDVPYIKRLIGLPGDRVQVVGGEARVNGVAIPRQAAGLAQDHDAPGRIVPRVVETAPSGKRYVTFGGAPDGEGDNTAVYVVPQGMYFFMGDNRDNSLDSRWPREVGVGFVPAENLVGRAEAVVLSWRQGASVLKPSARPTRFSAGTNPTPGGSSGGCGEGQRVARNSSKLTWPSWLVSRRRSSAALMAWSPFRSRRSKSARRLGRAREGRAMAPTAAAIRAPAIRWRGRRAGLWPSRWPSMKWRRASLAERPSSRQAAMNASLVG